MHKFSSILLGGILLLITACGGSEDNNAQKTAAAAQNLAGNSGTGGAATFRQYCVTCHGADGTLGLNGAKDLTVSALSLEERVNIITNGKKLMTPFNTLLSPQEIQAVAEYTQTLKK